MTKKELIEKLREIQKDTDDIEKNHKEADDLLLEYIGDMEVSVAFSDVDKWYA
jgi:predicted transposase YdaD